MENWAEIRRRVLVDGLSKRAACREYDIHWDTLTEDPRPPRAARLPPHRPRGPGPSSTPSCRVIHQILEDDRKAPRKQRHTAKRIFERLRDEHGYTGGLTVVKEAVAAWQAPARRGLRPAGPPARRGPGRLRRGRGHPRRPADQGGAVRHDPAVLRRDLRAAPSRASAPRRSSRATSGPSPSSAASPAGSATTTPRSPWPRSPAAATASSPTSSSGSRATTSSRPTSAWCGGPTRRGTSRRWSATPAATSSSRSPPCTAAWSRSTPGSRPAAARTWRGGCWGKPATKAELLAEERRGAAAAAGRGVRGRPGRAAARRLAVAGPLRHQRLLGADRVRPPPGHGRRDGGRPSASSSATAWWRPTAGAGAASGSSTTRSTTWPCWSASPGRWTSRPRWRAGSCRSASASCGGGWRPSSAGRGRGSSSRSCGCWSGPSPAELTRAVERALELGVADADAVRLILEHRRERPVGPVLPRRPAAPEAGRPCRAPDLAAYASLTAGVAP